MGENLQVCRNETRERCDVVSREEPTETCDVVPRSGGVPTARVCRYTPRPVDREVCQEVKMQAFREECREVPRQVPRVQCRETSKKIELKEICINVDLQARTHFFKNKHPESFFFKMAFLLIFPASQGGVLAVRQTGLQVGQHARTISTHF